MNKIEVKILNPEVIKESEKMMVCAARLTQRGHAIKNMNDFMDLYNKDYKETTAKAMTNLPHPTIQKFGVINLVIVGASRRFLAQITRHQNEVKFMSASLQYSDYSDSNDFTVPYEILGDKEKTDKYLEACKNAMSDYKNLVESGVDHDDAGFLAPQGLRNILIISATPYQLKHMISQRICRRNSKETRYVMLKIWEALYNENPILFGNCGAPCQKDRCLEGKMTCGNLITKNMTPTEILHLDFPKVYHEE